MKKVYLVVFLLIIIFLSGCSNSIADTKEMANFDSRGLNYYDWRDDNYEGFCLEKTCKNKQNHWKQDKNNYEEWKKIENRIEYYNNNIQRIKFDNNEIIDLERYDWLKDYLKDDYQTNILLLSDEK